MILDLSLSTLYAVYEGMPKPKTFLFDTFFGNRENIDTETVVIEFQNGRRLMAPFVDRYIAGQEMPKESFSGRTFKPYKIEPKKTFKAADFAFERMAGENPFLKDDPDTKKSKKIAETTTEQVEQISRRWEAMAAEVLYNLTMTVKGTGVDDVVNYYDNTPAEHTTTAVITWDNPASNPIADIKGILRKITEAGGTRPNKIILDPLASDLFQNHEKVKEIMDLRNYYIGDIKPEVEGMNGTIYIGTLASLGLDIYEYQEYYDYEENGITKTKALVPEYTVLFAPTGNLVKFGAESTISSGILQGNLIPRTYEDEKNNTIEISTISKPVLIPLNTKSLKVLKVK